MEQVRLLVAIAISFAVFFLWSMFFAPQPQQAPAQAEKEEQQEQVVQAPAQKESQPGSAVQTPSPSNITIPQPSADIIPARTVTIETELYKMVISERGAVIKSVVLKAYRENIAEDSPLKELISPELTGGSVQLNIVGDMDYGLADAAYTVDQSGDSFQVSDQPITLKFQHQGKTGLVVEKAFTFQPDSYLIDLQVNMFNNSDRPIAGRMVIGLGNVMDKNEGGYGFAGPSGLINGSLEQVKIKKIEENVPLEGSIRWVALENRYFMTSLILKEALDGKMVPTFTSKNKNNQADITNQANPPNSIWA